MTADQFLVERQGLGLTQADLARQLGLTARAIRYYEAGDRAIPRVVELAVMALVARARRDWSVI